MTAQKDWLKALAAQMTALDRAAAEPYLGRYSHHTKIAFSAAGLTLQTDFGVYPLYATDQPGLLAVGSTFTGILAVQRREDADGEPVFTLGRPISDPLTWPLPIEPLGR